MTISKDLMKKILKNILFTKMPIFIDQEVYKMTRRSLEWAISQESSEGRQNTTSAGHVRTMVVVAVEVAANFEIR